MRPLGVELVAMLANRGVRTVFGIPGVHNVELYRGIEEAGIRHVLARNEMGAGFMADGYARATGEPGVCFVITGPGFTNIMTPLGQAYSDSVPLLVIASCLDETAATKGQLHQMRDQEGAGRCVAEWSETARTPEAAYQLVDRALGGFHFRRSRPTTIHIPIQTLAAVAPVWPPGRPGTDAGPPEVQPNAVFDVGSALRRARKPLFVLGGGAQRCEQAPRLLNRWRAASFTTYAGRGIMPLDSPRHFGASLARPASAEMIGSADLVIVIGSELSEVDLWRDSLGAAATLVRVDCDADMLTDTRNPGWEVMGDAFSFLDALDREVPEVLETDWSPTEIAATRSRWKAEVDAEFPGVVPVADALRAAVSDDTMIFSDMTQFAYAAKEVWDMPRPGHWHHPYGFGTLGYALPAAIGGALGHDGPTLAIAGDSGLQYTLQELGTAAELGLSLPILLWDNDALKQIEDCMVAAQIAPNAVHQINPDWRALAAAYRIGFEEPQSLDELAAAMLDGFKAGRPTLIRATPKLGGA